MSRVRDALKRAKTMQLLPAQSAEELAQVLGLEEEPAEPAREPESVVRASSSTDLIDHNAPEEFAWGAAPPARPRAWRSHPLLRQRWVRRLLEFAGVRTGRPVPTCSGVTRLGRRCRAPAMANGFCRMHGGSRSSVIAEKTRSLLERISPAR